MNQWGDLTKPAKGEFLLERKGRSADRRDAEDKVMQTAKKRDGNRCRWPGCSGKHRGLALPIDACHQVHRGMGSDKGLTRTTTQTVVALCRRHHGQWDAGLIDLRPISSDGFDGLVSFCRVDPEGGEMLHVATEERIGLSVTR